MTFSNLTELERRVTDVLHHHAEIAMTTTELEARYGDVAAGIESSVRRRRVTWGIGAVATAAAIVIAVVLGGLPGLSSDRADAPPPADTPPPPASDRTQVQIAADFVDALAAYDAVKAAHDVGTSEDNLKIWPGEPSLQAGLAWAEAAGYKVVPKDCVSGQRAEGSTIVSCSFGWHFLGSDRLGQRPYDGGEYRVWVQGDRIVSASIAGPGWYFFGLLEERGRWGPFASWLEREHPADVAAMIDVGEEDDFHWPVWTDESYALWATYVDEWVASQQ